MPVATVMGKPCPFCGTQQVVRINDLADYNRWLGGTLIQEAMPYLNLNEREALMTGIYDPCWSERMITNE